MRAGSSRLIEQINPKEFNIIDLSFLIRILNTVTLEDLFASDNFIGVILLDVGNQLLNGLYTNDQYFERQNDTKIVEFVTKIKAVCNILNR